MSLPSTTSLPSVIDAGVARVRGSRSGCSAAYFEPAVKASSFPFTTSALFFPKRLRIPFRNASGSIPSQPAKSPITTEFLAFSVPAVAFAIWAIGTAIASFGTTPGNGSLSGATPVAES